MLPKNVLWDSGPLGKPAHLPLCHKDNHLTHCWDHHSEENQKAPGGCSRIWFPHLRITSSENVSLFSCYETKTRTYSECISVAKTPLAAKMMMLQRPCLFVQTVWEGRSRSAELEEISEIIRTNRDVSHEIVNTCWEQAAAHKDSVLLPLTTVAPRSLFVRRLQKLPWGPILGPVRESGQFFSQEITSFGFGFGLGSIRGTFLVLTFCLWVFQWNIHEEILAEDFPQLTGGPVHVPEDHWKIPWAVAWAALSITKFRVITLCI